MKITLHRKVTEVYRTFYSAIKKRVEKKIIDSREQRHKIIVENVKKKEKITVLFFVSRPSIWKYDGIYKLMLKDNYFNPIIVAVPDEFFIWKYKSCETKVIDEIEKTYQSFLEKKYTIFSAYDFTNKQWIDVKNKFKPDLVFFNVTHQQREIPINLISRNKFHKYEITNYLDTLTSYVSYYFRSKSNDVTEQYDKFINNVFWIMFSETIYHKKEAEVKARNKGKNIVVSGYPGLDIFLDINDKPEDKWKQTQSRKKRIIWAPHHTINGKQKYSCFVRYSEIMLKICEKYSTSLQIAFKPHPQLRTKLNEIWGIEKTNRYYKQWSDIENGQLEEGDYVDLFLTSDAMIHDSVSFMTEYLATRKPVLYTLSDTNIKDQLNMHGKLVYQLHYHASNEQDIEDFIKKVVINEKDVMFSERNAYIENNLKSINDGKSSEFIYNHIKKELS